MPSRSLRHLLADERGQSAVEFALVLPLLLFVLLLIVDAGKAFNYYNDANQLAAEGARQAAVSRVPSGTTLQDWVLSQADSQEMRDGGSDTMPQPAQVCIEFPSGTSNIGDPVKVTVTVDYDWVPFLRGKIPLTQTDTGLTSVDFSGSATMRIEAPPTYDAGCT